MVPQPRHFAWIYHSANMVKAAPSPPIPNQNLLHPSIFPLLSPTNPTAYFRAIVSPPPRLSCALIFGSCCSFSDFVTSTHAIIITSSQLRAFVYPWSSSPYFSCSCAQYDPLPRRASSLLVYRPPQTVHRSLHGTWSLDLSPTCNAFLG